MRVRPMTRRRCCRLWAWAVLICSMSRFLPGTWPRRGGLRGGGWPPGRGGGGGGPRRPRESAAAWKRRRRRREALAKRMGRWRFVEEYVYTSAEGEPRGKVVRRQQPREHGYDKTFLQFHWRDQCRPEQEPHEHGPDGWGPGAPGDPVLECLPRVGGA